MTPTLPSPWSPHWRSLHPLSTDDEILDALKDHLERARPPQLTKNGGAIASLQIFRQGPLCFRLPDGRLCHWAKVPKNASTSIEAALCEHAPHLWRGAHKQWALPARQNVHQECRVFLRRKRFPLSLFSMLYQREQCARTLDGRAGDKRGITSFIILINRQNPAQKPWGLHALKPQIFKAHTQASIRFCMVREPMERFVSSLIYLKRNSPQRQAMSAQESIDWALQQLALAPPESRMTSDMHLRPQSWHLGREPSYYTHIFGWGEWERLEAFLSDLLDAPVQLPRMNQGPLAEHPKLTPDQKRIVEAFYSEDYQHWSSYFGAARSAV